jgi:hypothetical protein
MLEKGQTLLSSPGGHVRFDQLRDVSAELAVIHRRNRDASPKTTRGAHFLISADAIPRRPVTNTGGGFPEISAECQRNKGNTTAKCENEHQCCDEGLHG